MPVSGSGNQTAQARLVGFDDLLAAIGKLFLPYDDQLRVIHPLNHLPIGLNVFRVRIEHRTRLGEENAIALIFARTRKKYSQYGNNYPPMARNNGKGRVPVQA